MIIQKDKHYYSIELYNGTKEFSFRDFERNNDAFASQERTKTVYLANDFQWIS